MKIGRNDFAANGKVENYMAYALRDQTLKGDFTINSNYLNVSDFMADETKSNKDTSALTVIEIPKNLNLALTGNFKQLIYDKMNFMSHRRIFGT